MRAVLISFLIFMASMLIMLPSFNIATQFIPAEFLKFAPFLLMALAMLCQWNALRDYKITLELNKIIAAKVQSDSHQSEATTLLEKRLAEQEREFKALKKSNTELMREKELEKENANKQIAKLQNSLVEAQTQLSNSEVLLSETEKKLQTSIEEVKQHKNQPNSSELLSFLSLLQDKGRFLDFLMDDITLYSDAQVGAAGRVVHQGCAKVLSEFFNVSPLHRDDEGSVITLRKEDSLLAYRVLGRSFDTTPFDAKILHRGWGTDKVNVPRRSGVPTNLDGKFVISPVEVEAHG